MNHVDIDLTMAKSSFELKVNRLPIEIALDGFDLFARLIVEQTVYVRLLEVKLAQVFPNSQLFINYIIQALIAFGQVDQIQAGI